MTPGIARSGEPLVKVTRIDVAWEPHLPIFASERYMRLLGEEYGWLAGVGGDGQYVCILPFVVVEKAMFRLVRFPSETIPLGPALAEETERAFLNGAIDCLRALNVDVIVPATFSSLFRTYPDDAIAAPYGNLVVDLTQSEELLWSRVHNKHRNVIRNATKHGVTIKIGVEHLETAFELTFASFMRSARSVVERRRVTSRMDYRDFQRLVDSLGEYVQVLVADLGGAAQCAAVIPYSAHSAYYMHGGSIAKPLTGASNLLQWEAMRHFKSLGVARYNFFGVRLEPEQGSKAEGIRKFKERFGGELATGFMWKMPFRQYEYALYEIAARIRNGGDVVDQELRRRRAPGQQPPPKADGPGNRESQESDR